MTPDTAGPNETNDKYEHQFLHSVVHIALTAYPVKQKELYVKRIQSMFDDYLKSSIGYTEDEGNSGYFSPLAFHIFGHYDVAFITLINNYKFAQRVFDIPVNRDDTGCTEEDGAQFKSSSYQVLAGSVLQFNDKLKPIGNFFVDQDGSPKISKTFPFLSVTSLKLNNGVLIGNGYRFKKLVIQRIDAIIREYTQNDRCKFILINSFSWNELTLLLLAKKPNILSEIVLRLRQIQIKDLPSYNDELDTIIDHSLYRKMFSEEQIGESHVLVDTHSYMGIDYEMYSNGDPIIIDEDFETIIEWQTRPGHIKSLINNLNIHENGKLVSNATFKSGKTDYITLEANPNTLASNHKLFRKYREQNENGIHEHVRKLKTMPSFPVDLEKEWFKELEKPICSIFQILVEHQITDIDQIVKRLKSIKISRQLRKKVEKVFLNFNSGMTDSISCIYFIDFYPFLRYIEKHIRILEDCLAKTIAEGESSEGLRNDRSKVDEIEKNINLFITAFEEAYQIRILNNYNYEDFNEFNVDFNSSITQILSTYDAIIKKLSPHFFDDEQRILVSQNEVSTKSNHFSINYNVYHLLEPPLVFNTIIKEILNNFHENIDHHTYQKSDNGDNSNGNDDSTQQREQKLKGHSETIKNALKKIRQEYIQQKRAEGWDQEHIEASLKIVLENFDPLYFQTDYIKYAYTFNYNTDLYVFWSWAYFLQNTSVYNTLGHVDENLFIKELTRILYTVAVVDPDYLQDNRVTAPIPELYGYWERHYFRLKNIALTITQLTAFTELVDALKAIVENYIVFKVSSHEEQAMWDFINELYEKEEGRPEQLTEEERQFLEADHSGFDHRNNPSLPQNPPSLRRCKILEAFYLEHAEHLAQGKIMIYEYAKRRTERLSPELYFAGIAYTTLRWYYKKAKGEINLLRRDYRTGDPAHAFFDYKKEVPFFIDSNGDFFIINKEFRNQAMRFKHAVLESLSHLGQIIKKDFFTR